MLHSSRSFTSFYLLLKKKYSLDNTFVKSNVYSLYSVRLPIFSCVRCSFKRHFSNSRTLLKNKRSFLRRIRNYIGSGKRVKNFNSYKEHFLRSDKIRPFLHTNLISFLFLLSRSRQRGKSFFFKYGNFFLYSRAFFRFLKKQKNRLKSRGFRSLRKRQNASFFYKFYFNRIRLRKYSFSKLKYKLLLFSREFLFRKLNRRRRRLSRK